jgi:hypothetical protein
LPAVSPIAARPNRLSTQSRPWSGIGSWLGYEDLIDHDELRHDPVMAMPAGELEARRRDCAPVPANRPSTGWS